MIGGIVVMGRERALELYGEGGYSPIPVAIVSIFSHDEHPPEFDNRLTPRGCYLKFDDVGKGEPYAMCEEQVHLLLDFVQDIEKDESLKLPLVVQCPDGVSRSVGCAAAIGDVLGHDTSMLWHDPTKCPNMYVYRLIRKVAGLDVTRVAGRFD